MFGVLVGISGSRPISKYGIKVSYSLCYDFWLLTFCSFSPTLCTTSLFLITYYAAQYDDREWRG